MTDMGIASESHGDRNKAIALTDRYPHPTISTGFKGDFCWVKRNIFCQENYCPGCEIYQRRYKDDRY